MFGTCGLVSHLGCMMSSVITQFSPCGVRSHSELGVLNLKVRQCRAQELPPPRVSVRGAPPVSTSGSRIERRDLMKMVVMVSGAAVLNLAKTSDAHAAARNGVVETPEQIASSPLIQQLLERSRAHKAQYDQERLDDYYKRNFTDYFEFVEGSVRNKKEMTAAEKAIVEWLAKNK